jgi:RNA recognition motif-containing protein
MGKKLFVGSLAWGVDDQALSDAFAPYGTVTEAKVIRDRETDRSRGFGFVTYSNDAEAKKAMEAMNGQFLAGRSINVNEAEERSRSGGGGFSGGGGGGGGGGFGGGRRDDRGGGGGGGGRGGDDRRRGRDRDR